MIIRDGSYERLRYAIVAMIKTCDRLMVKVPIGSLGAYALEDDLIEWETLLRELEDARPRA